MSINHAILGILSCKSLTGYDLKKIIQESPFMYWSGNNNQIYKSLVELLEEGYVTNEVHHQESSPSKKIYTITKEGLAELKGWVICAAEPPELKKQFLVQLAWADQLSSEELDALISGYEEQIRMQILMQVEKHRRGTFSPARTGREVYLWDKIHENIISSYESELNWLKDLRSGMKKVNQKEMNTMENNKINYSIIQKNNKKYIDLTSAETPIGTEDRAMDLISLCFENETNLLLLHSEILSEDFFKLRTGLAGTIMQKLINYHVRGALLLPEDFKAIGKFKDLMVELKESNEFRVFYNITEAEAWLIS